MGIGSINAQDTQLFRFVNLVERNGNQLVLHHNLDNNDADFIPRTTTELNRTDGYLQSFILQPIAGRKGVVMIASAKAPNHFLKRTGQSSVASSNERVFFDTYDENTDDINVYSWEIIVEDEQNEEGAIIAIKAAGLRQYGVQCQFNGRGLVTFFRNTNNSRLTNNVDNETVANGFKYRLQRVTNVF